MHDGVSSMPKTDFERRLDWLAEYHIARRPYRERYIGEHGISSFKAAATPSRSPSRALSPAA